jgi:sugar lactone lactonase YvrE
MSFPAQRWRPAPVADLPAPSAGAGVLDDVERLPVPGNGPEDVVVDDQGRVITGLDDGRIVRLDPASGLAEVLADTGGRPLGIEWLPDGDLLVCDAEAGLLRVPREGGAVAVLVSHVGGERLVLTNNAAVEDDGTIWFTESTRCNPLDDFVGDVLEHNGSGRLLRRDADGNVDEVLDGLSFANGVTLVGDDAVWVAETAAYTIHRVQRTGPTAGTATVVTAGLPGFPDNLSTASDGTIWAPLPNPRNPIGDAVKRLPTPFREVIRRIPDAITDRLVVPFARVLGFAPDGTLRHDLTGSGTASTFLTGAREHDGWLYLGSVDEHVTAVVRVRIPD